MQPHSGRAPEVIALDTETTGLDLVHGCRPFLVTICNEECENIWWEWRVDPKTRKVCHETADYSLQEDLAELQREIDQAEGIALQHSKFDVTGLELLFKDCGMGLDWPWEKTHDTLYSAHLLASNQPRDLGTLSLIYLRKNIRPLEFVLDQIVKEARKIAKVKFPQWRIARPKSHKKGPLEELPSTKKKVWKNDLWLPATLARFLNYPKAHDWWHSTRRYANGDSSATLGVHLSHQRLVEKRGLKKIYEKRRELLPIVHRIQGAGVTANSNRMEHLETDYRQESDRLGARCMGLASSGYGFALKLPKSGTNNSLRDFILGPPCTSCEGKGAVLIEGARYAKEVCTDCYGKGRKGNLDLPAVSFSKKTKEPSLDAKALEAYEARLPLSSKAYHFVKALREKRKRDTSLSYMESYRRFWLPKMGVDWYWLSPSLNPTGTSTLRWSSQNPNEQNISKKSIDGFSLRYAFGPVPGREWWSIDAANIELRLPAYESNEREMIELFEQPNAPPYFGSYHLLVFDTLHPKMFAKYGTKVKDIYKSSWYQWTKNGNFAVQYGAVEESGTADRAYHVGGAQRKIQERFRNIAKLNQEMIAIANRQGYVETIPDKTVDPDRGYPLLCTRNNRGHVTPTIPLNYHIQGTACWWIMKAMIRVQEELNEANGGVKVARDMYYMNMQVHDELVFDFPRKENLGNLPLITKIARAMEKGGDDFGIPTPVNVTYHPENWGEGVDVALSA